MRPECATHYKRPTKVVGVSSTQSLLRKVLDREVNEHKEEYKFADGDRRNGVKFFRENSCDGRE